jgi:phenylpyruvate tautomerase PptA (4-oxalocrotonate tautomerase family)
VLSRGTLLDVALARIEILEGRSADEQRKLIDAVAAGLSEALKAPEADPSVRLLEYPPARFSIPYPDRHSDLFTLVEVTMFAGRSMDTKRRLYHALVDGLTALDVPRNDILIVLHEPPMHNWGCQRRRRGERGRRRVQGGHLNLYGPPSRVPPARLAVPRPH